MLTLITVKDSTSKLKISNNDLPWKGKVVQTEDATTFQSKTEGELISFFVTCNNSSMEPGREYSVLAKQEGTQLVNVSYQTSN